MNRALILCAPLFFLLACQSQSLNGVVPKPLPSPPATGPAQLTALAVNDPCAPFSVADCQAAADKGCIWATMKGCVGNFCNVGACVTANSCATLTTAAACQDNASCVWSAIAGTSAAPALCPIGQDCSGGGFCFERGLSGNSCLCIQPFFCPDNGVCPPVQCDCPPSGGGTCTCDCPACPSNASCPMCDCSCGNGGSGGGGGAGGTGGGCNTGTGGSAGGGGTGAGGGTGTCTCNCPECPAGEACPACSCACSNGATTTMTLPKTGTGGGTGTSTTTNGSAPVAVCGCPACPAGAACAPCGCGTTPPADPCTTHTDVSSCTADTADGCGWTSLNIECITTPCPTGSCAQEKLVLPVDAGTGSGGGGCACACPACAPGETCPPCACDCCPATQPQGPVTLQPQPVSATAH